MERMTEIDMTVSSYEDYVAWIMNPKCDQDCECYSCTEAQAEADAYARIHADEERIRNKQIHKDELMAMRRMAESENRRYR